MATAVDYKKLLEEDDHEIMEFVSKVFDHVMDEEHILQDHKALLEKHVEDIHETLHEIAEHDPNIVNLFGGEEEEESLLQEWYLALIDFNDLDTFFHNMWRMGLIHIVHGLKNYHIVSIADKVKEHIVEKLEQEDLPEEEMLELINAFEDIADIAIMIMSECYARTTAEALSNVTGFKKELVNNLRIMFAKKLLEVEEA